jgi:hypothetical protein
VVDNKPGASGNIGAAIVAKAAPDGYTLMVTVNTFTIRPALFAQIPYDPVKVSRWFHDVGQGLARGHVERDLVGRARANGCKRAGEAMLDRPVDVAAQDRLDLRMPRHDPGQRLLPFQGEAVQRVDQRIEGRMVHDDQRRLGGPRGRRLALLERRDRLRRRRLRDVHAAVDQPGDRRLAGRRHRVLRREAFLLQVAAGDGGDERRVERREARELNADVLSKVFLRGAI